MIVDPANQAKALQAVLKTLKPETLTLPESLLAILPPHPPGYPRTQESFPSHMGLAFDPVAAAESSADLTLALLCDPERATRLSVYNTRVPKSLGLREVLQGISSTTAARPEGGQTASSETARAVEFRGLEAMLALAVNTSASSQAQAITRSHIDDLLHLWTAEPMPSDTGEATHRRALIRRSQDFEHDPEKFVPAKPITAPPGMPIGDEEVD